MSWQTTLYLELVYETSDDSNVSQPIVGGIFFKKNIKTLKSIKGVESSKENLFMKSKF